SATDSVTRSRSKLFKPRNRCARKPAGKIIHDRLHATVHRVQSVSNASKRASSLVIERPRKSSAKTASRRAHVSESALRSLASSLCSTTDTTRHSGFESLKVDLALGHHVRNFFGGLSKFLAQQLQNRDATRGQLHHIVALQLAAGSDRTEDV